MPNNDRIPSQVEDEGAMIGTLILLWVIINSIFGGLICLIM